MKNATCLSLLLLAACEPYHVVGVGPIDPGTNGSVGASRAPGAPPSGSVGSGASNPSTSSAMGSQAASDPASQSSASSTNVPMPDQIVGQLTFAGSEDSLATQPRTDFTSPEMTSFWLRVRVNEMPDLALLHLTFVDVNGVTFYRESAWFATRSGVGQGVGQIVYLASAAGSGFDLDVQPALFTARPADPGEFHVEASLDGYSGTITGQFVVR